VVAEEWARIYADAGLVDVRTYLRKMVWLMPRVARAVRYLGYVLVRARKPDRVGSDEEI
jgi:hypothetical protein